MAGEVKQQNFVPMVGVEGLHMAKFISDNKTEYTAGNIYPVPGLNKIGFTPKFATGKYPADNNPNYSISSSDDGTDGNMELADIPNEIKPQIIGGKYDEATGEYTGTGEPSGLNCILYKVLKTNKHYRYVKLFKAKVIPSGEDGGEQGNSPKGKTYSFQCEKSEKYGGYYKMLDTDDVNLAPEITPEVIEKMWFTDVNWDCKTLPTGP